MDGLMDKWIDEWMCEFQKLTINLIRQKCGIITRPMDQGTLNKEQQYGLWRVWEVQVVTGFGDEHDKTTYRQFLIRSYIKGAS